MAAKKKTTRRAKTLPEPKPAPQRTEAGGPPEEVPELPADAAPADGEPERAGPPVAGIGLPVRKCAPQSSYSCLRTSVGFFDVAVSRGIGRFDQPGTGR